MGIFEHVVNSQAVVLSDLKSYISINTLFGVVVVLAVLLLIALAYLMNIKSYLMNNASVNTANKSNSVDNAITQIVSNNHGELVGDHELVAVITAAIYASMGDAVPADGLVVRSIRKVNR
ncbi:MAG: OadG family transporter subunit [Herbinix sp.]|nr:OadG family transporter subunit [Herbinix sp.]